MKKIGGFIEHDLDYSAYQECGLGRLSETQLLLFARKVRKQRLIVGPLEGTTVAARCSCY